MLGENAVLDTSCAYEDPDFKTAGVRKMSVLRKMALKAEKAKAKTAEAQASAATTSVDELPDSQETLPVPLDESVPGYGAADLSNESPSALVWDSQETLPVPLGESVPGYGGAGLPNASLSALV